MTRRDVVIAQVGAGSENVAVGKNIFQLNVAGHNITPYILVIMAATLAVVAYLFYPYAEPLWNPWPMTGDFNIAVAGFGALDGNGQMQESDFGDTLSASVFSQINDEYKAIKASGAFAGNVQVWHDSVGATRERTSALA
ncbi:MAG: hypothetical protein IPK16_23110 [Anaerolineales bacterium]|nr:hypothetical protein [Anaerolineales bacterium]